MAGTKDRGTSGSEAERSADGERLAAAALADPSGLDGLLEAVGPSRVPHPEREGASAALKLLAERRPALLLERWDELAALLESDNAFSRMSMIHVIALLAPADDAGRFAALLDRYYDHLGDTVGVAGHVLLVTPGIVAGRPELRARITERVLGLAGCAIAERLGLLRGYAIEALDAFVPPDGRDAAVVDFVAEGLTCDSPKTRRLAADVLRRWGVATR